MFWLWLAPYRYKLALHVEHDERSARSSYIIRFISKNADVMGMGASQPTLY